MILAAPLALLGLLALPAFYLLIRRNPPPPRRIKFPPLTLLNGLEAARPSPLSLPLWLLLLRMTILILLILGLAGPRLHPPPALPGTGPVLLVIDNGWASAADWPALRNAATLAAAAAGRAGRTVFILATAPDANGASPHVSGALTAAQAAQLLAALVPRPWPVDRAGATAALQGAPVSSRLYIADGVTDGAGFAAFLRALRPQRIFSGGGMPPLLGPAHVTASGGLAVHLISASGHPMLLGRTAAGDVVARTVFDQAGNAAINLPPGIAGKLASLALDGPPTAGGTLLLDGASRSRAVGLAPAGGSAEMPFLGAFYFIRRALPAGTQVFNGSLPALIAAKVNVIVLADAALNAGPQQALLDFINAGGTLLRFAGPETAAKPDPLWPGPLLGDRRLGGSLSWTTPLHLAPFPAAGPFAGLAADTQAVVSRQVLADPTSLDPGSVWAALQDGTPLVLGKAIGAGFLVSVLTTANADWSSLPLSGLYPAMLARLLALGPGAPPAHNTVLPLQSALTVFGALASGGGAMTLTAAQSDSIKISPAHPAGMYGAGGASLALNLGGHVAAPMRADLPGAVPLSRQAAPVDLEAGLIMAAALLVCLDLLLSFGPPRGGLWRRAALLACLLLPGMSWAQSAALQTELGYIQTGDAAIDQVSADGLGYISADVSAHTSAQLGPPAALDPARDDLGLYPLIYWPVLPDAPAPEAAACAAFNQYIQHGGLLLVDSQGSDPGTAGSGAAFAPGAAAALARATACLDLPLLEPLTTASILARCFYIIPDFPGRFTGAPILAAAAGGRDADGVTPIIIGQNDWAASWARDDLGGTEQVPIPGGEDQRRIADRFGTNLVIYALTGNYKADQVNIPHLLDRLGQ